MCVRVCACECVVEGGENKVTPSHAGLFLWASGTRLPEALWGQRMGAGVGGSGRRLNVGSSWALRTCL